MHMEKLYQEIILDHYRTPHHFGLRDPFDTEVHHVNPTCGDEVTLRVRLDSVAGSVRRSHPPVRRQNLCSPLPCIPPAPQRRNRPPESLGNRRGSSEPDLLTKRCRVEAPREPRFARLEIQARIGEQASK